MDIDISSDEESQEIPPELQRQIRGKQEQIKDLAEQTGRLEQKIEGLEYSIKQLRQSNDRLVMQQLEGGVMVEVKDPSHVIEELQRIKGTAQDKKEEIEQDLEEAEDDLDEIVSHPAVENQG